MKHGEKFVLCALAGLLGCGAAQALTTDSASPYGAIVERNVFGLKPPPAPIDPTEANKPPPIKITLTGITTILGNKRALLKTPPPPGKPGEPAKTEQSYILTIGQREGDIEVLEIDENAGTVKVNNAGILATLSFEKEGAKSGAGPAPGGAPPGMMPAGFGVPAPAMRSIPTAPPGMMPRSLRTPQQDGGAPAGFGSSAPAGFGSTAPAAGYGIPMAAQAQQTQAAAAPTVSPAEQMLMMEAQREANRNNPTFPPLPPTALSSGPDETGSGSGSTLRAPPGRTAPTRPPGFPQLPMAPMPQ